jgi:cytochrome c
MRVSSLLPRSRSRLTMLSVLCFVAALTMGNNSHAYTAGDASRGTDVFDGQCAECHSVKQGKNKKGPSLFAVVGRKASSIAGFSYSDAMQNSGITWTAEKLNDYIMHPKKTVPGDKMKFDGLDNAKDRTDLIQFLAGQH